MTAKALVGRRTMFILLALLVTLSLAAELLYEFSTLWFIAINTQPVLFGPAFALVLSALGFGGLIAGKIKANRHLAIQVTLALIAACGLVLVFSHDFIILLAAQTLMGTGITVVDVLLTRDLHDQLPSEVRAGASSALSTISRIILIPLALCFGALSAGSSIFAAAWLLFGLLAIAMIVEFAGRTVWRPRSSRQ